MYTKEDLENMQKWNELEKDAYEELTLAHHTTGEESEEHYINAIVAENAATYIVNHYRGET